MLSRSWSSVIFDVAATAFAMGPSRRRSGAALVVHLLRHGRVVAVTVDDEAATHCCCRGRRAGEKRPASVWFVAGASAMVSANDVAPAITAAARNPRRGMQHGQPEKEVRATVADMDGSGAKLRRLKLKAVGRCPYTSPRQAPAREQSLTCFGATARAGARRGSLTAAPRPSRREVAHPPAGSAEGRRARRRYGSRNGDGRRSSGRSSRRGRRACRPQPSGRPRP